jgi:hypothetical protein
MLAQRGASVIDTDAIARALTRRRRGAAGIAARFGSEMIGAMAPSTGHACAPWFSRSRRPSSSWRPSFTR